MWNKIAILIAVVLGVLAVVLVRNYIAKQKEELEKGMILVCVSKSDILEGEKITTEHIAFRRMPVKYKPRTAYFYKDREQLIGLTAKQKIASREYFLDNMFSATEEGGIQQVLKIPYGYRAMSLKMSGEAGVSGLCRPGDRVDVVATISTEEVDPENVLAQPEQTNYTMTVLPYAHILALDKYTGKIGEEEPDNYKSVTFLLTPLECEVLIHLQKGKQKAEFTYLLRNPNEAYQPEVSEPRRVNDDRLEQQIKDMIRFHGQNE